MILNYWQHRRRKSCQERSKVAGSELDKKEAATDPTCKITGLAEQVLTIDGGNQQKLLSNKGKNCWISSLVARLEVNGTGQLPINERNNKVIVTERYAS